MTQEGIELIKQFEGCRLKAYKCPAGVWTIGYGHTKGVTEGMTITEEEAEDLLKKDIVNFEINVRGSNTTVKEKETDAAADKPAIVNATGKVKKKTKGKPAAKKDDKKVLFVPK